MLCEICLRIFPTLTKDSEEPESMEHHATAASLQLSMQRGCRICTIIWQWLNAEGHQRFINSEQDREDGCTSYFAAPSPAVSDFDSHSTTLSSNAFTLEFASSDTLSTIASFTVEPAEGMSLLLSPP